MQPENRTQLKFYANSITYVCSDWPKLPPSRPVWIGGNGVGGWGGARVYNYTFHNKIDGRWFEITVTASGAEIIKRRSERWRGVGCWRYAITHPRVALLHRSRAVAFKQWLSQLSGRRYLPGIRLHIAAPGGAFQIHSSNNIPLRSPPWAA